MTAQTAWNIREDAKKATDPLVPAYNEARKAWDEFKDKMNHDPVYFAAAKAEELKQVEERIKNPPRIDPGRNPSPEIMRALVNGKKPGEIDVRDVLKPEDAKTWDALKSQTDKAQNAIEGAIRGAFKKHNEPVYEQGMTGDVTRAYENVRLYQDILRETFSGDSGADRTHRCGQGSSRRGGNCR